MRLSFVVLVILVINTETKPVCQVPKHTLPFPKATKEDQVDRIRFTYPQKLQGSTQMEWKKIRITLEDRPMQQQEGIEQKYKDFYKRVMITTKNFIENNLLVLSSQDPVQVTQECIEQFELVQGQYNTQYENTDFVVIMKFDNEEGVLAYASYCNQEEEVNRYRPNFGRIAYGDDLLKGYDIDDPRVYQEEFYTLSHEILHALGFTSDSYQMYWNDLSNRPYFFSAEGTKNLLFTKKVRDLDTLHVRTPTLVEYVQNQFDCDEIDGAQMENEGGSGSKDSHFEKTIFLDEYMNPSATGYYSSISKATFALMQDSLWYKIVDDSLVEPQTWGQGQGCDFYENACKSTDNSFEEFDVSTQKIYDFHSNGMARIYNDNTFTDTCPIYQIYSDAYCKSEAFALTRTNHIIGWNSKLFVSNIGEDGFICRPYTCQQINGTQDWMLTINLDGIQPLKSNQKHLEIFQQEKYEDNLFFDDSTQSYNISFSSTSDGQIKTADIPIAEGSSIMMSISSPLSIKKLCTEQKMCPLFCSSHGYCIDGICYCDPGYQGLDCSLTKSINQ